jgi:hypothetical protein
MSHVEVAFKSCYFCKSELKRSGPRGDLCRRYQMTEPGFDRAAYADRHPRRHAISLIGGFSIALPMVIWLKQAQSIFIRGFSISHLELRTLAFGNFVAACANFQASALYRYQHPKTRDTPRTPTQASMRGTCPGTGQNPTSPSRIENRGSTAPQFCHYLRASVEMRFLGLEPEGRRPNVK